MNDSPLFTAGLILLLAVTLTVIAVTWWRARRAPRAWMPRLVMHLAALVGGGLSAASGLLAIWHGEPGRGGLWLGYLASLAVALTPRVLLVRRLTRRR
jgi:hypothetical protein